LFSLCLSGFQSIHVHGERRPVSIAHPNNVRLSVRIGAGPPGSVLSCGHGHGLPMRPISALAPLARHRTSMRPGFVLASLPGYSSSVRQGATPSFGVGTGSPSLCSLARFRLWNRNPHQPDSNTFRYLPDPLRPGVTMFTPWNLPVPAWGAGDPFFLGCPYQSDAQCSDSHEHAPPPE
jgi:hypothetical protein